MNESLQVFRHFKGNRYQVITHAQHSENPKETLVVYVECSDGEDSPVWARPLAMWQEETDRWPDGVRRPRFVPETAEIRALFSR